jgi:putative transposase
MPRTARVAPAGMIFHVLNRGVGRQRLFDHDGDYAAFERCLAHALAVAGPVGLLAYCLMPNHLHLLVLPGTEGALARFMHRLTLTHTRRWQARRGLEGHGHVYQGRFKSFPVQDDGHLLTVGRYVERNARRAGLVEHAAHWRWGSLARRLGRGGPDPVPLADWPVDRPHDWATYVDEPQTDAELAALRRSVDKGRPFGGSDWTRDTATRLGLPSSERPRGRPRKAIR